MATAQARNTPSLRLNPRILKTLRLRRGKKQKHSGEKSSSRYLTRLKKIPSPEDYLRGVSLAIAILRPEMALESFFLHFVGRSSQKKKSPGKGAFWRFFLL